MYVLQARDAAKHGGAVFKSTDAGDFETSAIGGVAWVVGINSSN
jgi:hypothetical protein